MAELKPWAELESLRAALREAEAQRDALAAAWEAGPGQEIAELEAVIRQAAETTNAERGHREELEREVARLKGERHDASSA